MKAILLAAGHGARLRPLTDDRPKAMVSVRGAPLLVHARAALAAAGVDELLVVTGFHRETVEALGVATVTNPDFATTNMVHSLFCARDAFEGGFLLVYGDILFKPSIVRALLADPSPLSVAVNRTWRELWSQRMANPLDDAETLKLDARGAITELGQKPTSYDDVQGQYAGLVKVSAEAVAAFTRVWDALPETGSWWGRSRQKLYMTDFLQLLINAGHRVQAVPFDGGWAEVDTPEDLRVAEALPPGFFEG